MANCVTGCPPCVTVPERRDEPWKASSTLACVSSSPISMVLATVRTLGIAVAAEMRTTPGGALVIVKWPSSEVVTELWKPVAVAETLTPPSCPDGRPVTVPSISAPLATVTRTPSIG